MPGGNALAPAGVGGGESRQVYPTIQPMPARDATNEAATPGMRASDSRPPLAPGLRRARPIYRVFVSSTWLDLQPERRALMDALNRMEEMRFVGMEFFGNRPDDTHDASIDQVDLCEVLVGIIGHRYGSGITEAEYRRARERGLPCFVYFKREETARPELTDGDPVLAAKLGAFKQDLLRGHTVKEFTSPEELAANATADLHNWVAARWISLERETPVDSRAPLAPPPDADRTNILRLLERIQHDWVEGVLEASLHHRAWLELGLNWKDDAVEHPWDRIVVAPNRPIQTLHAEDSITGVFDAAQNTLLVLGEPGAGKTTTLLELARELIARARRAATEPAPVVLALSTWSGAQRDLADWLVAELGARYQVPKRIARAWLDDARLVLLLDGLDEVPADRRAACVEAINAFEQAHHPPGLAVTCRVAEYDALAVKLRLRAAICLQPLTPAQVERYFAAAGSGLEHLHRAMRDDAGLRELARTPLMLSVMTMAWRDAPATGGLGRSDGTIEERRRQLFDAYVQAALNRRGKSAGKYSAADTVRWLGWLARRMKAQGHTLFAVEQLQPGWLGGAGPQFGYFLATRLLGSVALALPVLLWMSLPDPKVMLFGLGEARPMLIEVSVAIGIIIGAVDFGFARRGWGGEQISSRRFFTLFFSFIVGGAMWVAVVGQHTRGGASLPSVFYLFMAGFAFCAPLNVRALDVKPTASMRWSWRQGLDRGAAGLIGITVSVGCLFLTALAAISQRSGTHKALAEAFGHSHFFTGLAVAAVLIAIAWSLIRPPRNVANIALAITLAMVGGEIAGVLGTDFNSGWAASLVGEFIPAIVLGVLGGFASMTIDPARGRNAGAWFWLRVPVLMFFIVGLVMTLPGFIWVYLDWGVGTRGAVEREAWVAAAFGTACGLAAFFRFGGFNGVQHFFLRWLLVRSGDLPPKAEAFFDHTAQLALMQKVGFGYRFIHALLLDHLAEGPASGANQPVDSAGRG